MEHLIRAIKYSLMGLQSAFKEQEAFRQEILVFLLIVPAGIWLGKTGVEQALLIGSWLFVMVVELINSAIEAVVDRVGLETHKLSGKAKDFGSASVFCAILLAATVWVLIILNR